MMKMIRTGDFISNEDQKKIVNEIIDSGRLTEGKYVKKMERRMEEYLGVKHAITVTNGTVALELVARYLNYIHKIRLHALIPAMTFSATLNAFYLNNYYCVLCDVNEDLQINTNTINDKDKEIINVVVPVHLMGYPANMDEIMKLKKKHNWIVVEDAAEAFGAEYKGKKVGTIGDFGCFSFYISHNMGAGELGLVVTNDDKAAEIMRSMKNHGRTGNSMKFLHNYPGTNFKTTEFMAGICYSNMKNVDETIKMRREHAKYIYDNTKNPKLNPYPIVESFSPLGYAIKADTEEYRDYICKKLNDAGIETRHMFPNLVNQIAFKSKAKFPVADDIEKRVFYVGCHQFMSEEDLNKIVGVLNDILPK